MEAEAGRESRCRSPCSEARELAARAWGTQRTAPGEATAVPPRGLHGLGLAGCSGCGGCSRTGPAGGAPTWTRFRRLSPPRMAGAARGGRRRRRDGAGLTGSSRTRPQPRRRSGSPGPHGDRRLCARSGRVYALPSIAVSAESRGRGPAAASAGGAAAVCGFGGAGRAPWPGPWWGGGCVSYQRIPASAGEAGTQRLFASTWSRGAVLANESWGSALAPPLPGRKALREAGWAAAILHLLPAGARRRGRAPWPPLCAREVTRAEGGREG